MELSIENSGVLWAQAVFLLFYGCRLERGVVYFMHVTFHTPGLQETVASVWNHVAVNNLSARCGQGHSVS